MGLDPDAMADVMVLAIKTALAPVLARQQALQDQIAALEEAAQRDATRLEGYTSFLQRDLAGLTTKVAVLETRPLVSGPPGEPGPPGKDGADGKAGLTYCGVYQEGKSYDVAELVTWAGSMWHCNEATTTKPGDGSKAWTLMVKRGRDGKDGKP